MLEERGHSIIEPSFSAEYALGNYLTYQGKVDDINLPWLTAEGEFIINGNRKVILSSLVRFPLMMNSPSAVSQVILISSTLPL